MSDLHRDALLNALPACNLPGELVAWLVYGFEVQRAGGDLLEALGLIGLDLDERDDMTRTVINLSPGDSVAGLCSYFIDCLDGQKTHTRPDMQRHIERLQYMGVPRSVRHLRRIVNGRRQDGWLIQGT